MPFIPQDPLETERLLLRRAVDRDAEVIFTTYARDTEVTRYLTWRPHKDILETHAFIRHCTEVWEKGTAFPYVMLRKEDASLLGMIELRIDGHRAEIGYVLARSFWGQGYMTEALRGLIGLAKKHGGLHRIWAFSDAENYASRRVLEKAGMQKEGLIRNWVVMPNLGNAPRDCIFYSLPSAG